MTWLLILGVLAALAQAADFLTTQRALRLGAYELNPLMRLLQTRIVLKAGVVALVWAWSLWLWWTGHHGVAYIPCAVLAAVGGWAAWHNDRVMQRR